MTPSSAPPPVMGPPQRTGAPPNVGITPSAIPDRPVMGPPQRTGAPPNVGITPSSVPDPVPQMGPEGGGRTTLPPTYEHMPTQQNVPGQVAVGTPTDADKPAAGASNAGPLMHTVAPARVTPVSDPRFTTFERPNIDQSQGGRGGGGPPQMGMLDLSHLFGPNPPLAKSAPPGGTQTPVPSGQIAPPPGGGPTPYPGPTLNPTGRMDLRGGNAPPDGGVASVATPMPPPKPAVYGGAGAPTPPIRPDDLAVASRKGGPIQRFSKGGIPTRPTMHLAGGGPSESGQTPNDATLAAAYNNSGQVPANWYSQPAYEVSNPGVLADRNTLQTDLE